VDLRKVDVLDYLTSLGIRNILDNGDEIQFSCPFPAHAYGDESPSAYMNRDTTAFFCHGCKARGNAVHFLAKYEGISPILALRYIRERYETDFRDPEGSLTKELESIWEHEEIIDELSNPPIPEHEVCKRVDALGSDTGRDAKRYARGRGLNDAVLQDWKIGYCQISDRLSIPIRNREGLLCGFKGRSIRTEQRPRYLVLGDRPGKEVRYGFPTYNKSQSLFGIERAFGETWVIVEGEFNAIAVHTAGVPNAVAIAGSEFSPWQREKVILFFDDDAAGHQCAAKVIDELDPYMSVAMVPEHDGDPADMKPGEIVRLVKEARSSYELWLPSGG
jgi:DNA primase